MNTATKTLVLSPTKTSVLGIGVHRTSYEESTALIVESAKNSKSLPVAAVNVHSITEAYLDSRGHGYRINQFPLVVPDGQPVRWGMNLLRKPGEKSLRDRVRGPELMLHVCEKAAAEGISIFLYGSTKSVLKNLRLNLTRKFPNLRIAGAISPPFRTLSPEEDAEYTRQIRQSGAGIVFVSLGCPKQEKWAFEHRQTIDCPILCVGAAFEIHSGNIPEAPTVMQELGLEWLYRLVREPFRLWKRYVLLNPMYAILLFLQVVKLLPLRNPEY